MDHSHFIDRIRAGVLMTAAFLCGAAPVLVSADGNARLLRTDPQTATPIQPPVPMALPDMDTLAKKMAQEISKKKIHKLVVLGGRGPENKVTNLGAQLRDAFSESLARQTEKARVLGGAVLQDMLRKRRVSEGMLCSDVIAAWIAEHASADAYVAFRVYGLTGSQAALVAELFTSGWNSFKLNSRVSGDVTLTDAQLALADSDYHPTPNVPGAADAKSLPVMAKCLYCPNPSYTDEGRRLKISGTVYLDVIVRADGLADNILVLKPLGNGLDAAAIDTVLKWKFEPAKDAQGQAIPAHVPIEISFRLR